jgi:hypothetical protein
MAFFMADLSENIEQAAADPLKVSLDGFSAEGHSLPDLIEADKHLARKSAAASTRLPFMVAKIRPPGAV